MLQGYTSSGDSRMESSLLTHKCMRFLVTRDNILTNTRGKHICRVGTYLMTYNLEQSYQMEIICSYLLKFRNSVMPVDWHTFVVRFQKLLSNTGYESQLHAEIYKCLNFIIKSIFEGL